MFLLHAVYISVDQHCAGCVRVCRCQRCAKCEVPFDEMVQIHHCRACGRGFCESCSSHRRPVPERNWGMEPVRVCDVCYESPPRRLSGMTADIPQTPLNIILIAPCGLRGCKNGPAPFPGRMSYKATKPGLVSVLYLCMFFYCVGIY